MLFVALSEDPVEDRSPLLRHKYVEHVGEDSPVASPLYTQADDTLPSMRARGGANRRITLGLHTQMFRGARSPPPPPSFPHSPPPPPKGPLGGGPANN